MYVMKLGCVGDNRKNRKLYETKITLTGEV